MLALKVVLAEADPVPTLIFDEVDSGVGGATAAAVGERLARLGRAAAGAGRHPFAAGRGPRRQHWRVEKASRRHAAPCTTASRVLELDAAGRREEIARMLSGATVTDEARAAADQPDGAAPRPQGGAMSKADEPTADIAVEELTREPGQGRSWRGSPRRSRITTSSIISRTRRRSRTPTTTRCASATTRSRSRFPELRRPDSPAVARRRRAGRRLRQGHATRGRCCRSTTPSTRRTSASSSPASAASSACRKTRDDRARRRAEDRRPLGLAALRERRVRAGRHPRRRHGRRGRHRQSAHDHRRAAAAAAASASPRCWRCAARSICATPTSRR